MFSDKNLKSNSRESLKQLKHLSLPQSISATPILSELLNTIKDVSILLFPKIDKVMTFLSKNNQKLYSDSKNYDDYIQALKELHRLTTEEINSQVSTLCNKLKNDNLSNLSQLIVKLIHHLEENNLISIDQTTNLEKLQGSFFTLLSKLKEMNLEINFLLMPTNIYSKNKKVHNEKIIKKVKDNLNLLEVCLTYLEKLSQPKSNSTPDFLAKEAYRVEKNRVRVLQHLLLQKFKGPNETKVPTLDQAFRRAAAFGTPEDLDDLLAYGAKLNSFDDNKNLTALHNAVIKENVINVRYLLEKHADTKLTDKKGRTAASYAYESKNEELNKIFFDPTPSIFKTGDILLNILDFLPGEDLYGAKLISAVWKQSVEKRVEGNLRRVGLSVTDIKKFHALPKFLQYIIMKWLIEKKANEQVRKIFHALSLSYAARVDFVIPQQQFLKQAQNAYMSNILSDIGLVLYLFNIISSQEALNRANVLCTRFGALILAEGLLTDSQLLLFKHSGSSRGPFDNLSNLICRNGFLALKEGLLTSEQAPYIYNLQALLTDSGLEALRERLITVEQAKGIYHSGSSSGPRDNLSQLMTKNGLIALRKGFITPEQAAYIDNINLFLNDEVISLMNDGLLVFQNQGNERTTIKSNFFYNLSSICKPNGIAALKEKLITQQEIEEISTSNLQILLNPLSLQSLRDGLLKVEQAIKIKDLNSLLSPSGIAALKEGIVTIEEAEKYDSLQVLTLPNGIQAIKERLITVSQAASFNPDSLKSILSDKGMEVMREKLITAEQAAKIKDLKSLLSPEGIKALRNGIITIEEAQKYKSLVILTLPNGIQAIREKLITLEKLTLFHDYGGPFMVDSLKCLLSDIGLQALKERLITPEQAAKFYHSGSCYGPHDNLHDLLTPIGLMALREKLITPEKASTTSRLNLLFRDNNKDILVALRHNLIKLDDFGYSGKFYYIGNFNNELKKIITTFNEQQNKNGELTQSSIILQKYWRGKLARNRYGLFKELQDCMKTANIHHLDEMQNIKKLLDKSAISEATDQMIGLKSKLAHQIEKNKISEKKGFNKDFPQLANSNETLVNSKGKEDILKSELEVSEGVTKQSSEFSSSSAINEVRNISRFKYIKKQLEQISFSNLQFERIEKAENFPEKLGNIGTKEFELYERLLVKIDTNIKDCKKIIASLNLNNVPKLVLEFTNYFEDIKKSLKDCINNIGDNNYHKRFERYILVIKKIDNFDAFKEQIIIGLNPLPIDSNITQETSEHVTLKH